MKASEFVNAENKAIHLAFGILGAESLMNCPIVQNSGNEIPEILRRVKKLRKSEGEKQKKKIQAGIKVYTLRTDDLTRIDSQKQKFQILEKTEQIPASPSQKNFGIAPSFPGLLVLSEDDTYRYNATSALFYLHSMFS